MVLIRYRRGCGISFSFYLILNTNIYDFMIYCHSPGGDAAAALSYIAFVRDIFSHHRATRQWPWQSLHAEFALSECSCYFLLPYFYKCYVHNILHLFVLC